MKIKYVFPILILLIVAIFITFVSLEKQNIIKIGVVTTLTGPMAYWGEGTLIGAQLAEEELVAEGINVKVIVEDGASDAKSALSAGQKLVHIDDVKGMYFEFNASTIALSSLLSNKDILSVYDAAPVSPLNTSEKIFKSYIDYYSSCKSIAQYLKDKRNVTKIAILEANLEFAQLCSSGVGEVFQSSLVKEAYNVGTQDLKTQLTKIKTHDPDAIFNLAYPAENLMALNEMRQLGMEGILNIGVSGSSTNDFIKTHKDQMENVIIFGLPAVSDEFISKIKTKYPERDFQTYESIALSYLHIKQMAKALSACNINMSCATEKMAESVPDEIIGFKGFENRIAKIMVQVSGWNGESFQPIDL